MALPRPDPEVVSVLVVEDDEPVRSAIRNVLTMYGWSVTGAADPGEALAAVRTASATPRLCILDLMLEDEIGGLALADLLHRLAPDIRFLFISGEVESLPRHTLDRVPTAFLPKPFGVRRLIEEASALLDREEAGE